MNTIAEAPGTSIVAEVRRIVHDLRGPLNAMRLSLDLLRRGLDRDDAGEEDFRRDQVKQIERLDRQITTMNDALSELIHMALGHAEDAES